jgi:hypothetical protein
MDTQQEEPIKEVKMSPVERLVLARAAKETKKKEIEEKLARLEELEKQSRPDSIDGVLPRTWRDTIDKILGNEFKASVMESSGGNYLIRIVIPERWDRRIGDEKQMLKEDFTTGLVRRSSDVSDITKWCDLIKTTIKTKYPEFAV